MTEKEEIIEITFANMFQEKLAADINIQNQKSTRLTWRNLFK